MNSHWPTFESDELAAVQNVLSSGKVNYWSGQEGKLFETEFASYIGCKHAIAVSNGTVALEVALNACNIKPGDEVITTPRTFIASASAIVMRGAIPVIADIDPITQNITAKTIAEVITPQTKAIICVHLAGWACDMSPIMALAKARDLWVIEDCAQAHGAEYNGQKVGSIGDIAAFSFCQDKIMTTGGEGGMITTNNTSLWKKAWSFKDHGKDYDTVFHQEHPPGFRWLHQEFGSNYRLSEMQSAIGRCQLKKLPSWNQKRHKNAQILQQFLNQFPFINCPAPPSSIHHAYYKFYAFFIPEKAPTNLTRNDFISHLNEFGLSAMQGSCFNITHEKAFKQFPNEYKKDLANANKLQDTSIMIKVDHTITYNLEALSILRNNLLKTPTS